MGQTSKKEGGKEDREGGREEGWIEGRMKRMREGKKHKQGRKVHGPHLDLKGLNLLFSPVFVIFIFDKTCELSFMQNNNILFHL